MNKTDRLIKEANDMMRTLAQEAKHEYCPICSTPDWEVWHEPGKCPKINVSDTCSKVAKRAEKTNKMTPKGKG